MSALPRFRTADGFILFRVATSCGSHYVWRDKPSRHFDMEFSEVNGWPMAANGTRLDGRFVTE